ncbi:hypothetical protein BT63DRAFT_422830 [Microthyrium microscopicum]|uniref:Uncharacterized protein n=1 Tax=Microthyrium microscopicum TaxID=703497 RepID=A0A6A6UJF9_9PEZI|nr:hypothetical protein BT63DRAFT_422830 [Microthyrium microscopicum]
MPQSMNSEHSPPTREFKKNLRKRLARGGRSPRTENRMSNKSRWVSKICYLGLSIKASEAFDPTFYKRSVLNPRTAKNRALESKLKADTGMPLFKLSSGSCLSWNNLNTIRRHSRAQGHAVNKPYQMYGVTEESNRQGLGEFHSCVIILAMENRLILREENQITRAGDNLCYIDDDIYFCPHSGKNSRLSDISWPTEALESKASPPSYPKLGADGIIKCNVCGIELCRRSMQRDKLTEQTLIWRYVDLGPMEDPDCPVWKSVIGIKERHDEWWSPKAKQADQIQSLKPPTGNYGSIMEQWCQALSLIYHFDRRAAGWLCRDGNDIVQKTWA